MHPWHDIDPGNNTPKEFVAAIEFTLLSRRMLRNIEEKGSELAIFRVLVGMILTNFGR